MQERIPRLIRLKLELPALPVLSVLVSDRNGPGVAIHPSIPHVVPNLSIPLVVPNLSIPPRRSEPEQPPRRSEPEYPPRGSDGESNDEGEDYAEFSAGKVHYRVWEASLY